MNNLKRCFLSITAVFIGVMLSGCAAMTNSLKTIDANTDWEKPTLTADLDVSPNKIVGNATGRKDKLNEIGKVAMLDALIKYNSGKLDKDIADLMVEPTYFYEYDGLGGVKITVIGYPARYKNFRMIEKTEIPLDNTVAIVKNNDYSTGDCFNRKKGIKQIIAGSFFIPFSAGAIVSGIKKIKRAKRGQCG
ncbi:MAG: hypothetical protein LBH98_03115 [Chitinispirillales bacterium]|jgi:hypothetical protein|nr:hypothetical protein [Chitinispirillales bacterium]